MAKSRAGTTSTQNASVVVKESMVESSPISPRKDRPRIGDGSKRTKLSDEDLLEILNADLNRLKERFGTVTLANTSTGKTCIVLPVEVGWCLRCNNIMLKNDSNLCERHSNGVS
jgi:hypothetical protein